MIMTLIQNSNLSLQTIKEQVQERIKNSSGVIALGVFKNLVKNHQGINGKSCGCNYCLKLIQYAELKLTQHRQLREYYHGYSNVRWGPASIGFDKQTRSLRRLEVDISLLKKEKDRLKYLDKLL
jgi:hypothetical protein